MIQKQTKKERIEWQGEEPSNTRPKRGNLKRSEVKRVVEKVVLSRRGGGETGQTLHPKKKK